jgi:hypothetical protein
VTAPKLAASCIAADTLGIENLHTVCGGNGPLYLPGIAVPVLPAEACACGCHASAAAPAARGGGECDVVSD